MKITREMLDTLLPGNRLILEYADSAKMISGYNIAVRYRSEMGQRGKSVRISKSFLTNTITIEREGVSHEA